MSAFWLILFVAVLVWYASITVYVGIRGGFDIRSMLQELARRDRVDPD